MINRTASLYVVLAIVALWLGTSSHGQPEPINADRVSPFESTPGCVLPCWNDYVPGQTTVAEVDASILLIAQVRDNFSFRRSYDREWIETTYTWMAQVRNYPNLLKARLDIVDSMEIVLSQPYTLREVYGQYGEPSFIYWDYTGDETVFILGLFYPEQGLRFRVVVEAQLTNIRDSIAFDENWSGDTVLVTTPHRTFDTLYYSESDDTKAQVLRDYVEVFGYCIPPEPGDRFGHLHPYDSFSPIVDITRRGAILAGIRTCTVE